MLEGHKDNVNGVAFTPDGKSVVTAGYDATLRIWPLAGGAPEVVTLPTPLNTVAIAPDGEIVAAGADGKVYFLTANGKLRGDVEIGTVPIIAVTISPDGKLVAAAGIRGSVAIIDRATRNLERTLVGPGLPVWSVAFFPDSRTLLTGGTDRMIRRWDAIKGEPIGDLLAGAPEDPLAAYAGDPGAEVYRACVACHTLKANDGVRAGPTLAGIFGRKIAIAARLQFLRGAEEDGHRLDAGDGVEAVRDRPQRIHARHQDAGAAHRLAGRSRGADAVFGEDDEEIARERRQPSPFSIRSRSSRSRR